MEWFLINNINKYSHNVTETPYAQFKHHECKIKLYRTKWAILTTANLTNRKYLALQIALLYLSKHTCALGKGVPYVKKNYALYGQ